MSELEDLVAIYGSIDRALKNDPGLAGKVAPFLGAYNDVGAIGWFDEFSSWTAELVGTSPFPELDQALGNLARTPTAGRMAARRLLALAVLARVAPALEFADASTNIEAALSVDGSVGSGDRADPSGVVGLVTNDAVFGRIGDWAQLIETGVGTDVLSANLAIQAGAPPCDCTLVTVAPQPGDDFPAAELRTSFTTAALTLEQATGFLDPSRWPGCSPYWCRMDPVTTTQAGTTIYHEIFSLDCPDPNKTFTVEAYLEFVDHDMPNGKRVSYRLSDHYANEVVDVDEGSLVVYQVGGDITVDTVKRIRFRHPFNGASLRIIMCALGYADVAAQLVLDCSGADPQQSGAAGAAGAQQGAHREQQRPRGRSGTQGVVDDAVDSLKQYLDECAAAYESSLNKIKQRTYTTDDLVSDVAGMWTRYLTDGAKLVGLAMQMATALRDDAGRGNTQPPARPQ